MRRLGRWFKNLLSLFGSWLFLLQASMLILLGLVITGAFVIPLVKALPLPDFLVLLVVTLTQETRPWAIALMLALIWGAAFLVRRRRSRIERKRNAQRRDEGE